MDAKVKRRLAAILCADVKGYTRLMEQDEAGTLATLRRYRAAMAALIARHDGRLINSWGDALIAEFASAVEAVQAAVEIQQELAVSNQALPAARQMWFRVGINLGDVMVEQDDLYGEGVNIAARLQELAEPGGILISAPVYDQVHSKLAVGFEHRGPQALKNVALPVVGYRVLLAGEARIGPADPGPALPAPPATPSTSLGARLAALPKSVKVLLCLIGFLFLINLFGGFEPVWFHWPATVALFVILLRLSLRQR